jgi:hypothetical protein
MNGPYDFASQFYNKYGPPLHRLMTAADLGIVDELLDEKVGMEPNPLDGTRLWDNS